MISYGKREIVPEWVGTLLLLGVLVVLIFFVPILSPLGPDRYIIAPALVLIPFAAYRQGLANGRSKGIRDALGIGGAGLTCAEIDREFGRPHTLSSFFALGESTAEASEASRELQWLGDRFQELSLKKQEALIERYEKLGCRAKREAIKEHLRRLYPG